MQQGLLRLICFELDGEDNIEILSPGLCDVQFDGKLSLAIHMLEFHLPGSIGNLWDFTSCH